MGKRRKGGEPIQICAFCGKSNRIVEHVISTPYGIHICCDCVTEFNQLLAEQTKDDRPVKRISRREVPVPAAIKTFLDQYVIGQERTKKILSVGVYNHYKKLTSVKTDDVELAKSNVLLVGPTGCGKTLLAETLARFLDVPFAISDATPLTEAGYVGEDVENILLRLLQAANFDRARAEQGIIFLDEIDKIGKTVHNISITRDVSGVGVQQALLKILEGTVANVPPQGGRKHPEQHYIQVNTSNILFICGGTFTGIEDIIRRRLNQGTIGFGRSDEEAGDLSLGDVLDHVSADDLVHYGMIPELVGRLPIVASLGPLSEEDLVEIMVKPKNAAVRQYQKLFEMEGKILEFTKGALHEIAKKALERETGARAIRSTIEDLMLDVMFDLPSYPAGARFVVTPAVVRGEKPLLKKLPKAKRESA